MSAAGCVQIAAGLGRISSCRTIQTKGGVVFLEGLLPQPVDVADPWESERPALHKLQASDGVDGRLQFVQFIQASLLLGECREIPPPYVALILASEPGIDKQMSSWSERSTGLFEKPCQGEMMDSIECEGAVQAAASERKLADGAA